MRDLTPLLKVYARFRLSRLRTQDSSLAQQRTLHALVRAARETEFGRAHGFSSIRDVAEFQARVPLRSYEQFWRDFWQPAFPRLDGVSWPGRMPYFALTSGTTSGVTKYIPVSASMLRANKRAALDLLVHHVAQRPRSRVLKGKSFMLGGSTDLRRLEGGALAGDLSGIAAGTLGFWARGRVYPPRATALLADWEAKLDRLADGALGEDIRSISGTPSWLLALLDRLKAHRPDRPPVLASWFPNLELLVHGGVNFAPYARRFDELLAGSQAELREVYPASEGFIAIADRGPGEGLRLLLDNGLFFEFVPVSELGRPSPTRYWIENAEPGVEYALALSSNAGLFAYLLGDTVRLIGRDPPRLLVTGRTTYMLSAFGEHVIDAELEAAVAAAAAAVGRDVTDWSVMPEFPARAGELGRHLYVIEFRGPAEDGDATDRFLKALDRALCTANEDYAAHRRGSLDPPRMLAAPEGAFGRWMKARGKLGGQHKVPRIVNDPALAQDLRAFIEAAIAKH